MTNMTENEIAKIIVDCAFRVHTALGPGFLESAYEACMVYELIKAGLKVEKQKNLPLVYDGKTMEVNYRLDLLVEDKVVIELKTVDAIHDIHKAQIIHYLKMADKRLGLILNFRVLSMRDGIKRYVNNF